MRKQLEKTLKKYHNKIRLGYWDSEMDNKDIKEIEIDAEFIEKETLQRLENRSELASVGVYLGFADAFSFNDVGYLIVAPPETGKTTNVSKFIQSNSKRSKRLAGNIVILSEQDGKLYITHNVAIDRTNDIHCTTADLSDLLQGETGVPIQKVVALNKYSESQLGFDETMFWLLQNDVPDRWANDSIYQHVTKMLANVPFSNMEVSPDVEESYQRLKKIVL